MLLLVCRALRATKRTHGVAYIKMHLVSGCGRASSLHNTPLWSLTRVAPNRSASLNLNQTCSAGERRTCTCCCYHPDMLAVISGVADTVLLLSPLAPTAAARVLTRAARRSLDMMRTGAGACGRLSGASPDRDADCCTFSGAQQQVGEAWAGRDVIARAARAGLVGVEASWRSHCSSGLLAMLVRRPG